MIAMLPKGDGRFPTTEWTLVARLRNDDANVSARALDDLCATYHYPLYCFIRHRGLAHHDAQDALHDFLAKLLRLDAFNDLAEEKGRLRTFLAKSLQRFLINRHRDESRRGADEVSLDDERFPFDPKLEQRYEREMGSTAGTPDVLFDRQWCEQLLQRVLSRLERVYAEKDRLEVFKTLRPVLLAGGSLRGHDAAALASALSITDGALRAALVRMLRDYRRLLVEEVRQTVQSKDDVEAEIAHLMSVVGS